MNDKLTSRPSRGAAIRAGELFTASDLARYCQVDLKTIHNWSDKGEIPHFRTPGRHLRFRRLDVLDFLRKYGYSIPEELRSGKPRLVVLEPDGEALTSIKKALSKRFDLTAFKEPYDALIAIAGIEPDGVIFDFDIPGFDGARFLARLKSSAATAHIRSFVYSKRGDSKEKAIAAGASGFILRDDIAGLREEIEKRMGVTGHEH